MSAPADSSALALSSMRFAAASSRPCTLNPPVLCTDCGFRPEVRAHGDVVAREEFDDLELAEPAFELHHLRAALLHEPHGVGQRDVRRRIARERQVGHQERTMQPARHRFAVIDDVVHGDRHRGVVTLQHHA